MDVKGSAPYDEFGFHKVLFLNVYMPYDTGDGKSSDLFLSELAVANIIDCH